jgi:hypothetical protein
VSSDHIYAVVRVSEAGRGLLLVNLSPDEHTVDIAVTPGSGHRIGDVQGYATSDLFGRSPLTWSYSGTAGWQARTTLFAYQAVAVDLAAM